MADVFLYEEHNSYQPIMKKSICLAASLLAFNFTPVFGQPTAPSHAPQPGDVFQQRLQTIIQEQNNPPTLTKFNLDFPGGTPAQLVKAIEKATSKPLNVIISDEDAATKLPPVKVSDMDVGKLFKTLSENGLKYANSGGNNTIIRNYGFKTIDASPSDNSLWTFYSYTKPELQTQFSLDFPGGTPSQLTKAVEKAMSKHINVIINKEDENVELPPLKMDDVFLPQLFTALGVASQKTIAVSNPGTTGSYRQYTTGYGFKSADNMTDTSVWYFYVDKPSLPPVVSPEKTCQFYSLSPYLARGFTVDDITTAIQTGWKMAGVTPTPELSYHKETKMLIAFGEPDKLQTIGNVLKTLPEIQASYWQQMTDRIFELQQQVGQLKKQLPATAQASTNSPISPAEKSGK